MEERKHQFESGVAYISDMRIVLLGYRNAGKSSLGNTILGRQEFGTSQRTAQCVMREGQTAGRHITVVEAPGWWKNYRVEDTPEYDKNEIVLSVSLCPPGPHALLLVIHVDECTFTETHRKSVQEHMELLSERVWNHTIVIFTRGDRLGGTSIEQHIENGGEDLQWVVEKCGNRFHVLDNKKRDGDQVMELLEKIKEMVAGNSAHHFHFDRNMLEKKKREKERAEDRKMKVQKQREILRSTGGVAHISDMRILLLGYRKAGKSSSGNTILRIQGFDTSGRTEVCVKREGETADRHITVVESPGWWKNKSVTTTHERDKQQIVRSVTLCPPGPHALLLTIRVAESFTETDRRAVQEHLELLGERVWSQTMVLFTFGEWLGDTSIEQHIESGEALKWVIGKCGNRYHVVDNVESDDGQVTELLEKIEEMVAGNSVCLSGTPRKQTDSKREPPKMSDSGFASQDLRTKSSSSAVRLTDKGKLPWVHENEIHIKALIDAGSFGSVYKGSYQGTPVAVKRIPTGNCPPDSLELVIPLRLSHPHIVKMIAVSRKEEDILIAYEYVHGANLRQIIHSQCHIKLKEEDKMFVALEIAMAAEYIHGKNIIHQDIKPANILVSERSKTAYLTDWGLANMKDSLAEFGVEASGSLCGPRSTGTELYMAPELLLRNERCSNMSDMWSLGITYLEMFTGSDPWTLKNRFALAGLLYTQERPHALAKLKPHLTEIVEPLVLYEPQSRMTATALVTWLKSKVDLEKKYGYDR